MPRKQKKYHFIYRTVCKVTKKFYVGMHSTDDLQDGYLGSGKILGYSLNKHGRENHKLEILEMCGSREQLKRREKEIVNEELLADPLNMNLRYGGEGGWAGSAEQQRKSAIAGGKVGGKVAIHIVRQMLIDNPDMMEKYREKLRIAALRRTVFSFSGKKHSEETKAKMRKSKNAGTKNSQFGTCWVTDGEKSLKIRKEELQTFVENGFVQGRKIRS